MHRGWRTFSVCCVLLFAGVIISLITQNAPVIGLTVTTTLAEALPLVVSSTSVYSVAAGALVLFIGALMPTIWTEPLPVFAAQLVTVLGAALAVGGAILSASPVLAAIGLA